MKIVDLFAGCGGLSLGFQNAGFDIISAFEYWPLAANCYRQNFKHPVFQEDLSDVDNAVSMIGRQQPDIIIGGPPCQDFSHAGKRIENKRAGLTEAFANIVSRIRPRWFVMENVDRAHKSVAYAASRIIFKEAGYGLTEVVLDASYCGVPQKRKRFFCIGSLGQEDSFLTDYIIRHLDDKETTVRDYFGASLDIECYYRHPRNYNRRAVFSIDEPAPTIRGVNRPVPQGYHGHANDACKLDSSIRAMTTLERALIQTFPADYKWLGNKTDMEQMIGNAVPVKLAEYVANALQHHIAQSPMRVQASLECDKFHSWLHETQSLSVRTERDIVSRLKRANAICEMPPDPDELYIFHLEHSDEYKSLTPAVRSQLKRSVTLYIDFHGASSHMIPDYTR